MNAILEGDEIVGLVAVVLTFSIPIVWIVLHYIFALARTVAHAGLKREMVSRGYSAQEIIDVVTAQRGQKRRKDDPWHGVPPAKPVKQPAMSSN